jgi:hypothetical protein
MLDPGRRALVGKVGTVRLREMVTPPVGYGWLVPSAQLKESSSPRWPASPNGAHTSGIFRAGAAGTVVLAAPAPGTAVPTEG